jgi:hypothetical protein
MSDLWGGLAFHTVSMLAGMFCMGMSYVGAQQAAVDRPQGTTPVASKS